MWQGNICVYAAWNGVADSPKQTQGYPTCITLQNCAPHSDHFRGVYINQCWSIAQNTSWIWIEINYNTGSNSDLLQKYCQGPVHRLLQTLAAFDCPLRPWHGLGPVLLLRSDAIPSLLTNNSTAFKWKMYCHWLIGLWQSPMVIVIRGRASRFWLPLDSSLDRKIFGNMLTQRSSYA